VCLLQMGAKPTSGSSGFLASLSKQVTKGLDNVIADLKTSPRNTRDLQDLRAMSAPHFMQRPAGVGGGAGSSQGVGVVSPEVAAAAAAGDPAALEALSGSLPPGWQAKYDANNKRVFYIDHNTKTTTWARPAWPAGAAAAASSGSVSPSGAAAAAYSVPQGGAAGASGGMAPGVSVTDLASGGPHRSNSSNSLLIASSSGAAGAGAVALSPRQQQGATSSPGRRLADSSDSEAGEGGRHWASLGAGCVLGAMLLVLFTCCDVYVFGMGGDGLE
jgi:hypothetical protein